MSGVAEVQQLIVDLRLRDQLTGGLGAAKAELAGLETQTGAATTRMGALSGSLVELGKVAVTAFAAFKVADLAADFFKGSIQGAQEEEASIARLSAALKANVAAWDGDSTAIEHAVRSREALGFSDDQLRTSFGSLVAATHDVNKALDIQNTAMDLARFKGVDLQTATTALIRVEGGRYRALADLGIVLQQGATQTEALAAVQAVAAGQAQAFGNTSTGAMQEASVAVHDLQEEIGTGLLPVIKDAAVAARTQLVPALSGIVSTSGEWSQSIDRLIPGLDEQNKLLDAAHRLINTDAKEAKGLAAEVQAAAAAARTHAAATSTDTSALNDYVEAIDKSGIGIVTLTGSALDAADAAETHRLRLVGETDQLEAAKRKINEAAAAADGLGTALDALPNNIDINVNLKLNTSGVAAAQAATVRLRGLGEDNSSVNQFGGSAVQPFDQTIPIIDPGVVAFREAQQRAREAAAQKAASEAAQAAKERARELAAAYKDEVSGAFDKAKRTADSLFDALHDRNVKAIKDAETLAEKQHSAAIQQITDALKVQEAQNAAPVNAAEKALRDREQAQQRRGLVESLDAAQAAITANTDPAQAADLAKTLRNATEALQNFDSQAAIDRLTAVQKGLDAKAEGAADAATAKADADLKAAKDRAQKDQDTETIAAGKRKEQFDVALAALKDRDLKANRTPAQLQADIDKLGARFGITTDKFGFHHIDDPLVTAIKTIKIPAPIFTPIINNKFLVTLNGRDVGAALASGTSPSATPAVRSGQGGRR